NLKPKKKNQYLINFKNMNINLPFGIEMINSNPEREVVKIEKEIRKFIDIEATLAGEVNKDLKLTFNKLSVKTVLLSGPRSLINTLKKITTKPIDLEKLKVDGKIKVELDLPDNRLARADQADIFWEFNVRATKANKKINNIPITFVSSKFVKKSSVRTASLIVLSGEDIKLQMNNIKITAEVPNDARGRTSINLKASLPENMMLLEIRPKTVDVYVK
ncbi:CdaR family protein, partial [Bacteriovoracaceae bacterium]|nr:CdaR family protein [Bacteriovoracaceae bacterium]